MSLDIWFTEDIKHILLAAERASTLTLAQAEESATDLTALRAYHRGYRAALTAVALACGLGSDAGQEMPGAARLRGGSR